MATDDVTSAKSGDSTINNNRIVTSVNGFTNNYISTGVNHHETLAEMVSRVDVRFIKSYKPLTTIPNVVPLDILASVGTSTSPTNTGTKAVTGVGFQPKVVMPFGTAALGSTTNVEAVLGLGVGTSSTNRATISVQSVHNVATSNTSSRHDNANIFNNISSAGVFQEADLNSLDADGFTLDWSAVSATARILNHICLGGADLEVSLTQQQMTNTTTSYAHGLTGEPTAVLLFTNTLSLAPPGTFTGAFSSSIGFWAGGNQASATIYSRNATSSTVTKRKISSLYMYEYITGYISWLSGGVSSVDSTNVNFSFANTTSGTPRYAWMLAIRGAKCQVGTFDCNGSKDPLTISTTGITPKLFLPLFVPGGVDNINTLLGGNALTIGASDGTNTVSCGITDENSISSGTNARRYQDSTGLSEYDFDGTLESRSSVSFSGESVVLDPSTNTGTTWGQGAYLVIGS